MNPRHRAAAANANTAAAANANTAAAMPDPIAQAAAEFARHARAVQAAHALLSDSRRRAQDEQRNVERYQAELDQALAARSEFLRRAAATPDQDPESLA
jgi:hypothetical protein